MPYCSLDDIRRQLPEAVVTILTDDAITGSVDEGVVADAIADADAEINAWLGGRYKVPFSQVPDVIRKISIDIAVYNLDSRRDGALPEVRKDRYRNAVKLLESIAKGIVTIGAEESVTPAGPADLPRYGAPDPVFTRETLKGF
jgi:phage gp36-like protein